MGRLSRDPKFRQQQGRCAVLFSLLLPLVCCCLLAGCEPSPGDNSNLGQQAGEIPGAEVPPSSPPQSSPSSSVTESDPEPTDERSQYEKDADLLFGNQDEPEPVYRPDDERQVPDPQLLEKLGINVVESEHIRIYSDLPPERIESLPPLVDELISALVEYFGELPPARDGKPFQLSGYIMEDVPLYEESGLLPPKFARLRHGRHQGAEFWMVVPDSEYYLRHLLFHEATHCYMMYMPGTSAPVWYLEGMAELFATHRLHQNGSVDFRVFPEESGKFAGFGRIELIKQNIAETGLKTIPQVTNLESGGYFSNVSYAWAWGLCSFFDQHPNYRDRFRQLARRYLNEESLARIFAAEFEPQADQLNQEWLGICSELEYGMDFEQIAIDFSPAKPLTESVRIPVAAKLGWQNSGWQLKAGETCHVVAEGMFELDETTRPWRSTAEGISIDYYRGVPLGRLLGVVRPKEVTDPEQNFCFARFGNFGKEITFRAPYDGTLYLRLNDRPDDLFNNKGQVTVTLKRQTEPATNDQP